MGDPLAVRDNAWIDAFAAFRKANLDAWAVYNNAIANASSNAILANDRAIHEKDRFDAIWQDTAYSNAILANARVVHENVRVDAYAMANVVRDKAIAEVRAILEKARADADAVYEKCKGK